MKRVTHKRAAELLSRVTEEQAAEIGDSFPSPLLFGMEKLDAERHYRNLMSEFGYDKGEMEELLRYSRR